MRNLATDYSKKSATPHSEADVIKYPIVFVVSMYHAGSIYTKRTTNPAIAYSLSLNHVKYNYPVSIVLWLKVGNDYMLPLFYTATSERDLEKAFQQITFDMANSKKILKGDTNEHSGSDSTKR